MQNFTENQIKRQDFVGRQVPSKIPPIWRVKGGTI
jgi:hypothetical protein